MGLCLCNGMNKKRRRTKAANGVGSDAYGMPSRMPDNKQERIIG